MKYLWRLFVWTRFIWPVGGGRDLAHECAVPNPDEIKRGDD